MFRLVLTTLAFAVALLAVTPEAWAGSYLNRAALLLDQSQKEGDLLQPRTHDKELSLIIKRLAAVRAEVGQKMEVPKEVAKAHPHLLLVLLSAEQAAIAAHDGDFKKFMVHLTKARNEARIFKALLSELGYTLPSVD